VEIHDILISDGIGCVIGCVSLRVILSKAFDLFAPLFSSSCRQRVHSKLKTIRKVSEVSNAQKKQLKEIGREAPVWLVEQLSICLDE
jgi:hypothetical protein